jgi:type VI secretion system protein
MLPGIDQNQSSTLHLRITACNGQPPAGISECVIDRKDGTLGRADSNDLVLADEEGVVSRVHARIEYVDDTYYLIDQSTNGTSLGSAQEALQSGERYPLNDGEQIQIGAFTIYVELTPTQGGQKPDLSSERLIDMDSPSTVPDAFAKAEDDLEPLSEMEGWSSDARRPDWFPAADEDQAPQNEPPETAPPPLRRSPLDQHMRSPRGTVPGAEPPVPPKPTDSGSDRVPTGYVPFADQFDDFPTGLLPDEAPETATPEEEAASPERPPPSRTPPPVRAAPGDSRSSAVGDQVLLDAFLRGLNLPSIRMPAERAPDFMEQLGELVRESVQGLIDILRLRAEFKHEFYVPATSIAPVANNLYKYSVNAADAISRWLSDEDQQAYLGAADSTRQAFQDLAAHQLALIAGMEAAVSALLGRFAPDALEERIGQASVLEDMVPQMRRARMWEAFEKEYRQIADQAAEDFQEILGQHFARAYTEQIKRLEQAGFGGKGPDNAQS